MNDSISAKLELEAIDGSDGSADATATEEPMAWLVGCVEA